MSEYLRTFARQYLSRTTRRKIMRYVQWPPVNLVRFGNLRRLNPISVNWGAERGQPIDRYYIEQFLDSRANDIRGNVLEVGDNTYTKQFGGENVIRNNVLHVEEQKDNVTIIGDLTNAADMPSDSFDCIILTQTLQFIYDFQAAIDTTYRILKPNGVLLATVPGISKISRYDMDRWGNYWCFTTQSMKRILESGGFQPDQLEIRHYGNVLASIAFLHGLAAGELHQEELDYVDPDYEMLVTARAVKR